MVSAISHRVDTPVMAYHGGRRARARALVKCGFRLPIGADIRLHEMRRVSFDIAPGIALGDASSGLSKNRDQARLDMFDESTMMPSAGLSGGIRDLSSFFIALPVIAI